MMNRRSNYRLMAVVTLGVACWVGVGMLTRQLAVRPVQTVPVTLAVGPVAPEPPPLVAPAEVPVPVVQLIEPSKRRAPSPLQFHPQLRRDLVGFWVSYQF
jgi:hypothetical protein